MPEKKQHRQNSLVPSHSAGSQFTKFCFSHDSRFLFCCCGSIVKVFNTKNGELLHDLIGHNAVVTGVAVNPTNVLQVFSCSEDGNLIAWDYLDGAKLKEHYLHMPLFGIVSINERTGSLMMIARTSQQEKKFGLLQWTRKKDNSNEFSSPQVLIPHCNKDQGFVSFGCMNSFAASGYKKELSVYSMKTGKIRVLSDSDPYNKDHHITSVACQPNEYCIAVGLENGRILLWYDFLDNRESKNSMIHWHSVAVMSLDFSPDGSILLSGGHECVFVRWQMNHHHEKDFKPRMGAPLTGVLSSPDGNYFATRHMDNVIQVMDINLSVLHVYRGISHPNWNLGPEENPIPSGLIYDPRSRCIVTNGLPGHLQFYSLSLQKQLFNLDIVGQNYISPENLNRPPVVTHVKKAAISEDGQWLASFEMWNDGTFTPELRLKFWQYSSQEQTYVLNTVVESPHDAEIKEMCFRPSPPASLNKNASPMLITTAGDRCFKLWTLIDDTNIYRVNTRWNCDSVGFYRDMETRCADFSFDGSSLAVSFGHLVTVWDPDTNVVRATLSNNSQDKQMIRYLKFGSFQSRYLLIAVTDSELFSFNLLSLTVEWSWKLKNRSLLIRDPASDLMATLSMGTLTVFKPKSPEVIYSQDKITSDPVHSAVFVPNNRPEDLVDVGWPGASQLYLFTQSYSLVTLDRPDRMKQLDKVKIHQNLPKSDLSALMAEKVVREKSDTEVKDTVRKLHIAEDDFASTMLHTNEPISAFCDQFINRLMVKKKQKKSRRTAVTEEDDDDESETEEKGDSDSGETFPLTDSFFDPTFSDFLKEESQSSKEKGTKLDNLLSKPADWVQWCASLSLK